MGAGAWAGSADGDGRNLRSSDRGELPNRGRALATRRSRCAVWQTGPAVALEHPPEPPPTIRVAVVASARSCHCYSPSLAAWQVVDRPRQQGDRERLLTDNAAPHRSL